MHVSHEGSSTAHVRNSGGRAFLHSQQAPVGGLAAWAEGAAMVWMAGTAQKTPPAIAPRLRRSRLVTPLAALVSSDPAIQCSCRRANSVNRLTVARGKVAIVLG